MKAKAHLAENKRWESTAELSAQFRQHQIFVMIYLEEKKSSFTPKRSREVALMDVEKIGSLSVDTFRSIQSVSTLLSQHYWMLQQLKSDT